jgi:hypothetical protein
MYQQEDEWKYLLVLLGHGQGNGLQPQLLTGSGTIVIKGTLALANIYASTLYPFVITSGTRVSLDGAVVDFVTNEGQLKVEGIATLSKGVRFRGTSGAVNVRVEAGGLIDFMMMYGCHMVHMLYYLVVNS